MEDHSHANCLFYILAIHRKSLLFQYLSRSIRMKIFILTGVKNERISGYKDDHMLR